MAQPMAKVVVSAFGAATTLATIGCGSVLSKNKGICVWADAATEETIEERAWTAAEA